MGDNICIECDQQCVMHSDDWHECHMTPRCDCGAWATVAVELTDGSIVDVCPSCAGDVRQHDKLEKAARDHGVPFEYYVRGVDPKLDFM